MQSNDRSAKRDENYLYWQRQGEGWFAEYERRKRSIPYLHLQEIIIAELVGRAAPASVLEYGCGVGRHLRNLSHLPGVIAFGYDQSPTMVAEMRHWAPEHFIERQVRIGPPVGRLPYDDRQFDLVFTCEALMHTRPEDVETVARELLRVARRAVFHLEPDPLTSLDSTSHEGCWGHDLASIYRSLGCDPLVLEKAFEEHIPIIVSTGPDPAAGFTPFRSDTFKLMHRMADQLATGNQMLNSLVSAAEDFLPRALTKSKAKNVCEQRSDAIKHIMKQARHLHDLRAYVQKFGLPKPVGEHDVTAQSQCNLCSADNDTISVEVLEPNPDSQGSEVWIRFCRPKTEAPAYPWSLIHLPPGWQLVYAPGCTEDFAVKGTFGTMRLPGGTSPVLNFMRHPFSGRIRITWKSKQIAIDLFSAETDQISCALGDLS